MSRYLPKFGAVRAVLLCLGIAATADVAWAQGQGGGGGGGGGGGAASGKDAFLGGASVFFYDDQSSQGERELPGGQTIFTYAHVQYNKAAYHSGIGLAYQRDQYGSAQLNNHVGLKLEFFLSEYYLEAVYGIIEQNFNGRSVSKREGRELLVGLGRRIPLFGPRLHFDLSIKRRSSTLSTEDGNAMPDPIVHTELMPFLGLGTSL